jgi:hypothetical protein
MSEFENELSLDLIVREGGNTGYERYCELGGIINEKDYTEALVRASRTYRLRECLVFQAESVARFAGFSLNNKNLELNRITTLYGVLRTDSKPGEEYHHGQMCDQRLLAETLRMLDYPELLVKVIEAYPNIDFA